jgi:hypothetical protein
MSAFLELPARKPENLFYERKCQNLLVYLVSSAMRQYREIHKWELALQYPYLYTGLAMYGISPPP